MARQALATDLHTLINTCKKKGVAVRKEGLAFAANGDKRILNISVAPLGGKNTSANERHYLVLFEDVASQSMVGPESVTRGKGRIANAAATAELKRIKKELAGAQDALRVAIESEEATKEEFQSANEEILSGNEELQSTNEELETSKEELQSTNEELNTLNEELRYKNAELHVLNNDLLNFLNSTQIPVVMLDRHSRIRRFTPNANSLFKVVASDIGRPILDLKLNLKLLDLETIIAKVLDTLQPVERDVQDLEDRWWSLHVLPYRTYDNKIDGTVLALQDVHGIKIANEQLSRSTEFFRSIINTVREPLLVLDSDLRVIAANEPYLHTFQVLSAETVNKFVYRLGNEQWNIPKLRALLEEILPKEKVVTNFQIEHNFPSLGQRTMLVNARTLVQAPGQHEMILLAIEDITERKLAEAALIKSEKLTASGQLAASLAHEINNPLQAVTNLMTLLGQSSMLNPQDRDYATLAAKELERVVHLVRQSLGLYRKPSVPTMLNVENVLDSILNLYLKQIEAKQIKITKQYALDGTVNGYAGDIRQIFSTLLVNALEANGEGGRITVRAKTSFNWKNPEIHGVRIVVADDGAGIPVGSIAHIFEPFFTTKEERGTGIGLWVTRGIVERVGGSIRVRSKTGPGRSGTCFSIFLPEQ